jgi:hypothetical protein
MLESMNYPEKVKARIIAAPTGNESLSTEMAQILHF